jgi:PncC family amidohydrolase
MTLRLSARSLALQLKKNSMSLACAESCTGGLAAASLTMEPGASTYFLGAVIAYSNYAKINVLGVPPLIIENHGAVSRETALAMAEAARHNFASDCAFSITGIAGPGGGSPEKPVGTVWFGFLVGGAHYSEMHTFKGDRTRIRQDAAQWALDYLLKLLLQSNELDNTLRAGVSLN